MSSKFNSALEIPGTCGLVVIIYRVFIAHAWFSTDSDLREMDVPATNLSQN
jgi:hypothetical protein